MGRCSGEVFCRLGSIIPNELRHAMSIWCALRFGEAFRCSRKIVGSQICARGCALSRGCQSDIVNGRHGLNESMLKQVVRGDGSRYRSLCKGRDIDTTLEKVQEILYRGRVINTCAGEGWTLGGKGRT